MSAVDKETGIWNMSIAKKRHKCDYLLAGAIGMYFKPERIADLGCGSGLYCRGLKDGFDWPTVIGYEGTKDITSLGVYDRIYEIDLTKKFYKYSYNFDLVLCLEVGEHIPPKHEQVFIDNVCKFASKDLILSWAVPGQYSASGHVNNQPNEYIIDQFEERGFELNRRFTNLLRVHCYYKWFKDTVMVFNKNE